MGFYNGLFFEGNFFYRFQMQFLNEYSLRFMERVLAREDCFGPNANTIQLVERFQSLYFKDYLGWVVGEIGTGMKEERRFAEALRILQQNLNNQFLGKLGGILFKCLLSFDGRRFHLEPLVGHLKKSDSLEILN